MKHNFVSIVLVLAIILSFTALPVEVSACTGKKHIVKFYSGKTLLKSQTVTCCKAASAPKNPVKSGYTFTGWDKPFNKVSKNMIVNAVFKPSDKFYNVSFNTGNGSKVTSQKVKNGHAVKKPTVPTRKGYVFAGWYSDSAHKTSYDFSNKVTKNIILYAKWKKDSNSGKTNNGNKLFSDVSMTIQDITPGGLSFFFTNTSDKEYEFGEGYSLFVFNDNAHAWEFAKSKLGEMNFDDPSYTIFPHSKTSLYKVDWRVFYDELPSGRYKFQKEITFSLGSGVVNRINLDKEFVLP